MLWADMWFKVMVMCEFRWFKCAYIDTYSEEIDIINVIGTF